MPDPKIPAHVYAKWNSPREATLVGILGFRVVDGKIENIQGSRPEIISVRPANTTEEKMWDALLKVEML